MYALVVNLNGFNVKRNSTLRLLSRSIFPLLCLTFSGVEVCADDLDHNHFIGRVGLSSVHGFQLNSVPELTQDKVKQKDMKLRLEYKNGIAADVALAYHYRPVSFEVEAGYLALDSDQMSLKREGKIVSLRSSSGPDESLGVFSSVFGVASLVYPVVVPSSYFTPYFGVGAGLLHYQFDTANVNHGADKAPSKKTSPLFRGFVGVDYRVAEDSPMSWGVRYRYQRANKVELELFDKQGGVVKELKVKENIDLSEIGLSISYRLDSQIK